MFIIIVILASIIEGIIGFGSTALALPFIIMFMDLPTVVPVMNVVVLVNGLSRIITGYKDVIVKEYLKMIGLMLVGVPFGIIGLRMLPELYMKIILGILIMGVGVKGCVQAFGYWPIKQEEETKSEESNEDQSKGSRKYLIFLFLGGIAQAAFACGGIFAAVYGSLAIKESDKLRMTMFAQAVTITLVITLINLQAGLFTGQTLSLTLWVIPGLVLAFFISNYLRKKVDAQLYGKMVNVILCIAGTSLIIQGVVKLI